MAGQAVVSMAAVAAPARPVKRLGVRLRAAVEKVIDDLARPGADAELVAGLAWTAACGETCQLTGPVGSVRHAIDSLHDGDLEAARSALRSVLVSLSR